MIWLCDTGGWGEPHQAGIRGCVNPSRPSLGHNPGSRACLITTNGTRSWGEAGTQIRSCRCSHWNFNSDTLVWKIFFRQFSAFWPYFEHNIFVKLASLRYTPYFQNRRASSSSPNSHMYVYFLFLSYSSSCCHAKPLCFPLSPASQICWRKKNIVNFTLPEHLQKVMQPFLIQAFLFCLHYPGHHMCSPAWSISLVEVWALMI